MASELASVVAASEVMLTVTLEVASGVVSVVAPRLA